MEDLLGRIKELDRHRIEYFLITPNSSLDQYRRDLREEASRLIQEIPLNIGGSAGTRQYLIGKILNTGPEYDAKSEEQLVASIRANTTRTDAWLELGQCVWKRGDLEKAYLSFKEAVERDNSSAKARCLLSAALRTRASRQPDHGQRVHALTEALVHCQEALAIRKGYSYAYYSLANTYLARFFAFHQAQERDLTLALESFAHALEDDKRPFINPDLHLNYALALYYRQLYAEALVQFRRALEIEPHFAQARHHYDKARKFLLDLREGIQRKGRISQRRLRSLLDTFPTKNAPISRRNGPTAALPSVTSEPSSPPLSVRCIGFVPNEEKIPQTLVCVDRAGLVMALTVYNCSAKFGALIGDTFSVLQPTLITVSWSELGLKADDAESQSTEEDHLVLRLIRVTNPQRQLLKNGRPLSSADCAFASMSIETSQNGGDSK